MKSPKFKKNWIFWAIAGLSVMMMGAGKASAHCDSLNGPIIPEARAALEKADITPLLKWVRPEHEAEIRKAFDKTVSVRAASAEVKEVADWYFFETLIRLHRAGEGAPYTGIKDTPVEPIVALAEKALSSGSVDGMLQALNSHMGRTIREKFDKVADTAKHKADSVAAGRAYVDAYVTYIHLVEGIHDAILADSGHQHTAAAPRSGADPSRRGQEH